MPKRIKNKIFIHPKANLEGKVKLGKNVSVWAFASIRGDEGEIIIGDNSSVQEGVVIHGKTKIGKNVTIGHGAIVHGAKIGNNVLIGANSTILDGVKISDWNIIGAGSLVPPRTKIKPGNLVFGNPAKIIRPLNKKDKNLIIKSYKNYLKKLLSSL
jgi:carbonic anhydrase/acetyltransferase-like protein (isoleucine patch superfamily)